MLLMQGQKYDNLYEVRIWVDNDPSRAWVERVYADDSDTAAEKAADIYVIAHHEAHVSVKNVHSSEPTVTFKVVRKFQVVGVVK